MSIGRALTTQEFVKKSKSVHFNRYDYSLVRYKNHYTKINIICKIHGSFLQSPLGHLQGSNCPKCFRDNYRHKNQLTTEKFIQKAKLKWPDWRMRFDFSKIVYKNTHSHVKIRCLKCNQFWKVMPSNFLRLSNCPNCSCSVGEMLIANWLDSKEIYFERHVRFKGCRDKLPLEFDFYIPSRSLLIEYDGRQHFKEPGWNKYRKFLPITKKHDKIKSLWAASEKINLLRIKYTEKNKIASILSNYFGILQLHNAIT